MSGGNISAHQSVLDCSFTVTLLKSELVTGPGRIVNLNGYQFSLDLHVISGFLDCNVIYHGPKTVNARYGITITVPSLTTCADDKKVFLGLMDNNSRHASSTQTDVHCCRWTSGLNTRIDVFMLSNIRSSPTAKVAI
jgi:hypothetical protein